MKNLLPSNRSFILVFVVFGFLYVGIVTICIFRLVWLTPCNRDWKRIVRLLHQSVNPAVLSEAIVCTSDAVFHCFMGKKRDKLASDNCLLYKERQIQSLCQNYEHRFVMG